MKEILKKPGKCVPITIDDDTRRRIKSFADSLRNMKEDYGAESKQAKTIDVILNVIPAYDRNILLAFYEYDESPTALGKLLGVSPSVILSKIKVIKKTIKEQL